MSKEEKMTPSAPYDQKHRLKKMLAVVTIVSTGQASSIVKMHFENDAAIACIAHGRGTSNSDFYEVMGRGDLKKDVIISIMREECYPEFRSQMVKRFKISQIAKGICFAIPITSVVGVSIYKMLTNSMIDIKKED